MPKIFISYSRKDRQFAYTLASDLARRGAEVWIDTEDIRPSQDWADVIQQALDECQLMIVIVSPDAMTSPNVADEWKYYKSRGKALLPLIYKPAEMHFQLHSLQYVSFDRQPYAAAFEQLCVELQRQGVLFETAAENHTPRARARRRSGRLLGIISVAGALLIGIAALLLLNPLSKDQPKTQPTPSPVPTIPPATSVHAIRPDNADVLVQHANIWDTLDFVNLEWPGIQTYERTIDAEPQGWAFMWCGTSAEDLQRLLKPFVIRFYINNVQVPTWRVLEYSTSSRCHSWATLVQDWQPGTQVQLDIRYNLVDSISQTPDPADVGEYIQRINVRVR